MTFSTSNRIALASAIFCSYSFGCSRSVLKATSDGSAFFYFGQQFLFLLSDGVRYLGQSGLAMINGSLRIVQLPLKFCTLDF